jgi:cAMP-dependent protein kinase regulator
VNEGELECSKVFSPGVSPTHLKVYHHGEAFGELALLYNCPRAASITAINDSILWKLDRGTFNNIVKDAAIRRRTMYEEFLKKVTLLSSMDNYERTMVSDAFFQQKWKTGDFIIKEGSIGDEFYFVVEGQAAAAKVIDGSYVEVM